LVVEITKMHPLPYKNPLEDARVQKALGELREMGLRVHLVPDTPKDGFIMIELNSIAEILQKKIKYPRKRVSIEEGYLVIYVWRD